MKMLATLFDVAPEPVAIGVALAVILFVIAVVILLAAGLVFFLWYRKRSRGNREMVRPPND
jgi:flagellar basal body-associated protein FliL